MRPTQPGAVGAARNSSGTAWLAPTESALGVLEIVASEQPALLPLLTHALLESPVAFAFRELAATFNVAPEDVGEAVGRACTHLDRLERHRRTWRDPAEVVESPNLAALVFVCRARINRVSQLKRRQKLERMLRRIEPVHRQARTRAWIDDFIGPLPAEGERARHTDR